MEKLKFLIVGSSAPDFIITKMLSKDADVYAFLFHDNPGIIEIARGYTLGKPSDADKVVDYVLKINPDIVFVDSETPLANGLVNKLEEKGYPCVAPTREAAKIDWDKAFARSLMEKYNIPGRIFSKIFDNPYDAKKFIDEFKKPVVVKPLGLTGGMGVKIVGINLKDNEEAKKYVDSIFENNIGKMGKVLIEERIEGEEFTLQAFVDGKNVSFMPIVQNYRHAFEDDVGELTPGMGSYSMPDHKLPFLKESEIETAKECINQTINALKKEGIIYRGIIYGQFIVGTCGLKLIEFNARFGDPEAINVLSIFNNSLAEVFERIIDGTIGNVYFRNEATVVKYLTPKEYPSKKTPGWIMIDEKTIEMFNAKIAYGSINKENNKLKFYDARALAVYSSHPDTSVAEESVENAIIYGVFGQGYRWRRDIGKLSSIQSKVIKMNKLRTTGRL